MTRTLAAAALYLGAILTLPAGETPRVFAHYMTCFSATPEFYHREIQLARRYGIDGFALNCGEWKKPLPDGCCALLSATAPFSCPWQSPDPATMTVIKKNLSFILMSR